MPGVGNLQVAAVRNGLGDLTAEVRTQAGRPSGGAEGDVMSLAHLRFTEAKSLAVRAFERRYLSTVLERAGGNITQAALAAGMDRSNFRRLLKEHGMAKGQGGGDE